MIRARRGERGFTVVELLISLTLTTVVIGMTFSIFVQSSAGMRSQSDLADLQQALVAAEAVISREVRQAGLAVPNGFRVAGDAAVHQAIEVDNRSDGPDELRIFAADPAVQARVLDVDRLAATVVVDDATGLAAGQVVVLTDPRATTVATAPVQYDACVVQIADVTGTTVALETAAPWGDAQLTHCAALDAESAGSAETMLFGFRMRGYRIDPARPELGVLQRSSSAGVDADWEDLAIGFTDLQVATRWHEPGDADDLDGDGDPELDWYAGDAQGALTAPVVVEPTAAPVEVTLSLVVRTPRDRAGVVSARTPALTDPDRVEHNPLGDRAAVQLEGVADADRPAALQGERVYRWSTMRIDLRNLGVGR